MSGEYQSDDQSSGISTSCWYVVKLSYSFYTRISNVDNFNYYYGSEFERRKAKSMSQSGENLELCAKMQKNWKPEAGNRS